jgi:hypothetical protein
MKHNTLDQLEKVAAVYPDEATLLSREERLVRWAERLEREPERRLNTLPGTEYETAERRSVMRGPDTPISVAFEDPRLKAEGLASDSYGDAQKFFELTDWQLHEIVCHCHIGGTMTAETAARRVRSAISDKPGPNLIARMRQAFAG